MYSTSVDFIYTKGDRTCLFDRLIFSLAEIHDFQTDAFHNAHLGRRWRTAEPLQGPAFVRLSARKTIYSAADVDQWLRTRRIDPSSAA